MSKTKIILIAVTTLVFAGGVYLYMNFNSMITRQAERIASDALGVRVNIGSIDISLSDKVATVNTIEIGNPKGYKKDNAITADSIRIGLNSAATDLIDFNDITVKGSVVNLEVNENGMNLLDLKNLAQSKKQTDTAGSETVRVIVKKMVIEASTINPSVTFLDRDITSITMPAIHFSNLGQGGGMEAGDAIVKVITKYINETVQQARQSGALTGVKIPGTDDVKKLMDDAKEGIKSLFQ